MLKITLLKSRISEKPNTVKTLMAMGLKKIGVTVTMPDNPSTRGMIRHVAHLVRVAPAS